MFFLNLTAAEFLTLFGVLGSSIAALYLLDRSRRKKRVSTLKFWSLSGALSTERARTRVNQPWSLLLQLLSLLLLLLAIAQLQIGDRGNAARDHVLLLDTSGWSRARQAKGSVLDAEIREAEAYLRSLPTRDRVLLARVDALTTMATPFTQDRGELSRALKQSQSNDSALDLPGAFTYATSAQRWSPQEAGEIVYVGPARIHPADSPKGVPGNLRVLPTPVSTHNLGVTGVTVSQKEDTNQSWRARVTLYNFGNITTAASLHSSFGRTKFAARTVWLPSHESATEEYEFLTSSPGVFSTELSSSGDSILEDNHSSVELSPSRELRVTVYTDRPAMFKPLLDVNKRLRVDYRNPTESAALAASDVLILDRFVPASPVRLRSIWLDPPTVHMSLPVLTVVPRTKIETWGSSHFEALGLRPTDDTILNARVFQTGTGDISFGRAKEGPVVVLHTGASPDQPSAIIGYDPLQGGLRFTITTPLLFANLLQWLAPALLREQEAVAGRVGAISLLLSPGEDAASLHILNEAGIRIPTATQQRRVSLFVNQPATLHAFSNVRDETLSLTLPDIAEGTWTPPAHTATGIPRTHTVSRQTLDVWKWLGGLGAAGLIAEWFLFGASRRKGVRPALKTLRSRISEPEREVWLR